MIGGSRFQVMGIPSKSGATEPSTLRHPETRDVLARLDGETSNELFETLTEWNTQLEHLKSDDFTVPPCP